jgi:acyl-CoA thioesterase FadM
MAAIGPLGQPPRGGEAFAFILTQVARMTPFEMKITATDADIDELGHVNNAAWVRWIQDMATAHWSAVADPTHVDAYVWVVIRHEIDYLRSAGPARR